MDSIAAEMLTGGRLPVRAPNWSNARFCRQGLTEGVAVRNSYRAIPHVPNKDVE